MASELIKTVVIPLAHHDHMLGGLYGLKTMLSDALDKTDHLIEASVAAVPDKTPKAKPGATFAAPPRTPPGGTPKTLSVLVLIGILSCAVGADHIRETNTMEAKRPAGPSVFMQASAALADGKYEAALPLFLTAADIPGADPESTLGGAAECHYHLGHDSEALAVCDQLDQKAVSAQAPLIRGLVYLRMKWNGEARQAFMLAAKRGHPDAEFNLKRTARQ